VLWGYTGAIAVMAQRFPTTSWSLIVASAGRLEGQSKQALATLCERYWYPLYGFIRRRGYDQDKARDLTQEFFLKLIEKNYVGGADRHRGKFRAFLLTAVKHFLMNEADREGAQKRGGGYTVVSIELVDAERWYQAEPVDRHTPEKAFERSWAVTLLQTATNRLQQESARAGKARQFERMKPLLTGENEGIRYSQIAEELGLSEGAVKVAVHRMRRRYREVLREEIAETVEAPEQIESELRYLAKVLET
jgi:RNA polymerase sigma factor (sigma-70 family)